jgi:putative endonuclease
MPKNRRFFVYIMTNRPRSHVLYAGVTGNLPHRVFQHKNKLIPGFNSRYNLTRLVYYEEFVDPDAAINREKEIKAWRRSKKVRLIETMNPQWDDLGGKWMDIYKPDVSLTRPTVREAPREIPLDDVFLSRNQRLRKGSC